MPHTNSGILEHLDRVMEQVYNFRSIKYDYDISRKDIKQAYYKTQYSFLVEGYAPVNQAAEIIEERKKSKNHKLHLVV